MIVAMLKFVGAAAVGLACSFLLLLATRNILRDDIRGKRARDIGTSFIAFFSASYYYKEHSIFTGADDSASN